MQRMDGDEDHVVVLIEKLDHLLRAAVGVGLDEAGEAADAVVDVHYVVADLYLVELLEREGEFAAARLV